MRALIVEPSRMIRNVFVSLFSKNGIASTGVETAIEALQELERESVNFLCFAMQLSDMTGLEFYAEAKARGLIGRHPSVLLTSSQEAVGSAALALGVTECFSKCEPDIFEEYVRRWVTSNTTLLCGNVLLIEDSSAQAAFLERSLADLGLTCSRVRSGEEAVAILGQQAFDLVIVDYMLEGNLTGLNVIRLIRNHQGRTGSIPILAISGFDDAARRIEMLRSGANDFVAKPVIQEELQVRVTHLVQLQQALDHLEKQHAILYEMAMRDRLTSVFNRHYIGERAQALIQAAQAAQRPLSLLVLDIDHFKRINDTHGHTVGDHVLVGIASAISEFFGEAGIVARMGGEEFMVVLDEYDEFSAMQAAEELRELIEELEPTGLHVTASVGLAQLQAQDSYESMYSRADLAMYQAKHAGRNRVALAEHA